MADMTWKEAAARVTQLKRLLEKLEEDMLEEKGYVPMDLLAAKGELNHISAYLAQERDHG